MFDNNVTVKGDLLIQRFNEIGELVESRKLKNLVVQSGKNFIASRMAGVSEAVMSHMAVGTDAISPVSTDIALNAELTRVALASTTTNTNVNTYVATYPAGVGTGALTEAGIFNASTGGTMLCRTTFAVVNKGANDSITITWNITIQ